MIVLLMIGIAACVAIYCDIKWREANRTVDRIIDEEIDQPRIRAAHRRTRIVSRIGQK